MINVGIISRKTAMWTAANVTEYSDQITDSGFPFSGYAVWTWVFVSDRASPGSRRDPLSRPTWSLKARVRDTEGGKERGGV